MKLKDYLEKEKIKQAEFAKRLGVHQQTVFRLVHEEIFPSYPTARAIVELSNNEVTMDDIYANKVAKIPCPLCGKKGPRKTIMAKIQEFMQNIGKMVVD